MREYGPTLYGNEVAEADCVGKKGKEVLTVSVEYRVRVAPTVIVNKGVWPTRSMRAFVPTVYENEVIGSHCTGKGESEDIGA